MTDLRTALESAFEDKTEETSPVDSVQSTATEVNQDKPL